jgi:hypothetical protein
MALRFCDGFEHYVNLASKWTGTWSDCGMAADGRYGGTMMFTRDGGVYKNIDSQGTWIVGFAISLSGFRVNEPTVAFIDIASGNSHVDLRRNSSGAFYFTRNGTAIGSASSFRLNTTSLWVYMEVKVTIDDTNGGVWLKVMGNDEIREGAYAVSPTTLDTRNGTPTTADQIMMRGWSGNTNVYYDDVYICDSSGSVNNDFLGDVRVQSIYPSGAGNTTQMTPSAGSNYACVDETSPNGDTDYVSETTAGEKDTYAFGSLTPTSGTIKGVQILVNARKDDAGNRTMAPVYRPASTDYDGTTVSVGDSYTYYREITEVSPATSAAWTIAEINGAEFGVKLIS